MRSIRFYRGGMKLTARRGRCYQRRLLLIDGAADEDDDSLPLVLVEAVLQGELRNLDPGRKVNLAM